jgi:hypothetical protein
MQVYTQGWSFEYSCGYGSQVDDLKAIQNLIRTSNNYGLKITDSFSGYITHTVALGYFTGYHHFGSNISYLTTGGRLNRADYSGFYNIDMIMNGYRLGAFYRYYINTRFSPLNVYLQISPGVLFSNLRLEEEVRIYDEFAKESNTLEGVGMYIEPTIGATYSLTNWLRFSLSGGYEFDFFHTLKSSDQNAQIKANWKGLRLYVGLVFILPNKSF